jgi:hypothetical protein
MISRNTKNGIEILTIKNDHLELSIAPVLGGKIISLFNRQLQKEFLWTNKNLSLKINTPGADYDSNFLGGIDELIPNDIPETIDGISYPDHGELWTSALDHEIDNNKIQVYGKLELSGLYYSRTVHLDPGSPIVILDYKIRNESNSQRHFLWKLHAALNIEAGDKLVTKAKQAQVVDPQYSRFKDTAAFGWPFIEGVDASIIPLKTNSMDFFYLYDIPDAAMQLLSRDDQSLFSYSYDQKIFPYQWYFASFGGFLDHYTAILEPCSSMPIGVNEAKEKKQCTILEPGEGLATSVRIFAGKKELYSVHE